MLERANQVVIACLTIPKYEAMVNELATVEGWDGAVLVGKPTAVEIRSRP